MQVTTVEKSVDIQIPEYSKLGGAEEGGWTCPWEWKQSLDSSDPFVHCDSYSK